jgi:BirA family biotin operon repressor/biotin-[acetyl-CoA-carboxylase] ligase
VAEEQTGGRGRAGSAFFSPRGGLYVSIVLRPRLAAEYAPLIGLAAGVGLAEAVRAQTGAEPILKWPNDLLLNGRKLSGLLVDLATAGTSIRYACLGMGLNVNVPAELFPAELRNTATSLLVELGRETPLDGLLSAVLARAEARYLALLAGKSVVDAWRAAPNFLGARIKAATPGEVIEGVAEDLGSDGALMLRLDSGERRRVVAADVRLLR